MIQPFSSLHFEIEAYSTASFRSKKEMIRLRDKNGGEEKKERVFRVSFRKVCKRKRREKQRREMDAGKIR